MDKELIKQGFSGIIRRDFPLAEKTSFKTGGNTDFFIEPDSIESLQKFISWADEKGEDFLVIGGGSNMLISDAGVKFTLSVSRFFNSFKIESNDGENIYINALAGTKLQKLCWFCAKNGFSGMNPLIGIPGSVGGAVIMNAGTNDGSISDIVEEIVVVTKDGKKSVKKKDADFGYRSFSMKEEFNGPPVVCSVKLRLKPGDKESIYKEAKEKLKKRKKNQPLKTKNAGSFFKNPENSYAGKLIDLSGLKGFSVGEASVSRKHGNFIINKGKAKTEDIIKLKNIIQERVKEQFDIELIPEVKIVGR